MFIFHMMLLKQYIFIFKLHLGRRLYRNKLWVGFGPQAVIWQSDLDI